MDETYERLHSLLTELHGKADISVDAGHPDLRLNLLPETISLWDATYNQLAKRGDNLLLACTKSSGPIEETSLTWVVGSAIRSLHVDSTDKCQHVLQVVGLEPSLAEAIIKHCPGIANEAIWALYYERHGHLVATPILSAGLGQQVVAGITSLPV